MISQNRKRCLQTVSVASNEALCQEHYRLTLVVSDFPAARPGEFVHLAPGFPEHETYGSFDPWDRPACDSWKQNMDQPMLRRAYSIAGLRRKEQSTHLDIIYRVVGTGTRWLQSLQPGDSVNLLGPLGNRFPISTTKRQTWLVAGGVGLPPMLWLAEALNEAHRETIAFCGARSADLLALALNPKTMPSKDAKEARFCTQEFAIQNARTILSTDDGSLGFHGHIGAAMAVYHAANPVSSDDLVVYTCGPERMMRFVAEYCVSRGIECHVCMERAMACGTGTCQSCVVPVLDAAAVDGWRYELCCTEGPVFDARRILWESPS